MTDDERKVLHDCIEAQSGEYRRTHPTAPDERTTIKIISELAYYLALRDGVNITDAHVRDALIFAVAMDAKKAPDAAYSMIYHYLHDDIPRCDMSHWPPTPECKAFNDSNTFIYLLSEASKRPSHAAYIFSRDLTLDTVQGWILAAYKRAWKENRLTEYSGHIMARDIWESACIAQHMTNASDVDAARGMQRVIKIIKGMHT